MLRPQLKQPRRALRNAGTGAHGVIGREVVIDHQARGKQVADNIVLFHHAASIHQPVATGSPFDVGKQACLMCGDTVRVAIHGHRLVLFAPQLAAPRHPPILIKPFGVLRLDGLAGTGAGYIEHGRGHHVESTQFRALRSNRIIRIAFGFVVRRKREGFIGTKRMRPVAKSIGATPLVGADRAAIASARLLVDKAGVATGRRRTFAKGVCHTAQMEAQLVGRTGAQIGTQMQL